MQALSRSAVALSSPPQPPHYDAIVYLSELGLGCLHRAVNSLRGSLLPRCSHVQQRNHSFCFTGRKTGKETHRDCTPDAETDSLTESKAGGRRGRGKEAHPLYFSTVLPAHQTYPLQYSLLYFSPPLIRRLTINETHFRDD